MGSLASELAPLLEWYAEPRDDRERRYASHIPVVRAFLASRPRPILEFGCGRFSTPVLAELAVGGFVSWEYSAQWRDTVADALPGCDIRLTPRNVADFCRQFAELVTLEHALFIDGGPNHWRTDVIIASLPKLPAVIFAHDWPGASYGYHEIKIPPAYHVLVYCGFQHIQTGVILRRGWWQGPPPLAEGHVLE
jgi:hypothetical protein